VRSAGLTAPRTTTGLPSGPRPARPPAQLLRAALAIASGLALLIAFPPYDWWPLAPVSVAALTLTVRGCRPRLAALLGLLYGLAFFVPLLSWTGTQVGPLPWLILGVVEACYLALLGAATALAARLGRWVLPWAVGLLWVGQETLRGTLPYGGFPWGRLAFAQADGPYLRLAAIGGAPLVTFSVALTGGALSALVLVAAGGPVRSRAVWGPALAAVGIAATATVAGTAVPAPRPAGPSVTIAVVQGNVPRAGLEFNAQRRAVLDNHVHATVSLADRVAAGREQRPDLVIWPENSSDIDPFRNPDAAAAIQSAADAIGVPILVGALLLGPGDGVTNAGIVWSPQDSAVAGPGERYAKRHLVPFTERIPLRPLARIVVPSIDTLVPRDFVAGTGPGVLRVGPATIGDVICFEVAYDGLVRDTVDGGAQLLAVQTNNATFGRSAESAQQLAMVRLRAVEHGRSAVMASTSGTSAVVAADGTVLDSSALFTQTVLVRDMPLAAGRTLATSAGEWPSRLGSVGALVVLLAAGLRARRNRPSRTRTEVEDV
jgi:apolipoprotein N-acyltransferase